MRYQKTVCFFGILAALAATATSVFAQTWQVQVDTAAAPIPFVHIDGTRDETLEASAVEPIDPAGRFVLIADDKTNALRVVEVATGREVQPSLTAPGIPAENAKWEAMAKDDAGDFYVIGSHNGRDAKEVGEHSFLLRFRLTKTSDGDAAFAIDPASLTRFDIAASLGKAVPKFKIEGLAVRTVRPAASGGKATRQLIIGLREPDDPITVYAADLPENAASPAGANLAVRRLFSFAGGTRETVRNQLSSIEYAPAWGGFLIVTSSEDEANAYHGNTLWFFPDGSSAPPQRVWLFGPGIKAEGLCLLPSAEPDRLSIVIAYDNDPARTKKASLLQTVRLVRWTAAQ